MTSLGHSPHANFAEYHACPMIPKQCNQKTILSPNGDLFWSCLTPSTPAVPSKTLSPTWSPTMCLNEL